MDVSESRGVVPTGGSRAGGVPLAAPAGAREAAERALAAPGANSLPPPGGNMSSPELEALRIQINLAFDLLDGDGNGALSRFEILRGFKDEPAVREMLQMPAFTNPAEFDAVYRVR